MIHPESDMMFNGYSDRGCDSRWVLAKGEPVRVLELEADYGARVCGLDAAGRLASGRTEWVWLEELAAWSDEADQPACRVSRRQVSAILAEPNSEMFKDLRNRAAYMYITGCYPTHLRPFYTGALTEMRRYSHLEARNGGYGFEPAFIEGLELDDHPMVVRARELASRGWSLRDPLRGSQRRSFQKIHLSRGERKVSVRITGETVLGWQLPEQRH